MTTATKNRTFLKIEDVEKQNYVTKVDAVLLAVDRNPGITYHGLVNKLTDLSLNPYFVHFSPIELKKIKSLLNEFVRLKIVNKREEYKATYNNHALYSMTGSGRAFLYRRISSLIGKNESIEKSVDDVINFLGK